MAGSSIVSGHWAPVYLLGMEKREGRTGRDEQKGGKRRRGEGGKEDGEANWKCMFFSFYG